MSYVISKFLFSLFNSTSLWISLWLCVFVYILTAKTRIVVTSLIFAVRTDTRKWKHSICQFHSVHLVDIIKDATVSETDIKPLLYASHYAWSQYITQKGCTTLCCWTGLRLRLKYLNDEPFLCSWTRSPSYLISANIPFGQRRNACSTDRQASACNTYTKKH